MALYENIKMLCERNHTNFSSVENETGLGNGVIGKWKKASPRLATVKKVADYFGVTVDFLLADHTSNSCVR